MSTPSVEEPGGIDLPPAPAERLHHRLRRRWRSRGRHKGSTYWFLFRGTPLFLAFCALYLINGVSIGWRAAYDVSLAIISPAATSNPALAWPLSIAGWLFIPGLAGAVAGLVISTSISSRRGTPFSRLYAEHDDAG